MILISYFDQRIAFAVRRIYYRDISQPGGLPNPEPNTLPHPGSGPARLPAWSRPLRRPFLDLTRGVWRRRASPVEASEKHRAERQIPILLISLADADRASIRELLRGTRFLPVSAESPRQAAKLMSEILFPIVLYDPTPFAGEWKTHLGRFVRVWRGPIVLLLGGPGDADSYENAVCRARVYVLPGPPRPDSLVAALELAYARWSLGAADGGRPCPAVAEACGRLPGCVTPPE